MTADTAYRTDEHLRQLERFFPPGLTDVQRATIKGITRNLIHQLLTTLDDLVAEQQQYHKFFARAVNCEGRERCGKAS